MSIHCRVIKSGSQGSRSGILQILLVMVSNTPGDVESTAIYCLILTIGLTITFIKLTRSVLEVLAGALRECYAVVYFSEMPA